MSIFPFISKIIEFVVVEQLYFHKSEHNFGEILQSAYKKRHSTKTAIDKVYNDILQEMDRGCVVLLALYCRIFQQRSRRWTIGICEPDFWDYRHSPSMDYFLPHW